MRTRLIAALLLALLPAPAAGQTETTRADRLSVGGSMTEPVVGTTRLNGLGTTGGTEVLFTDANRDVIRRILANADLPVAVAFENEANTFTLGQTFSSTAAFNGVATFTIAPVITNAGPTLSFIETGGTANRQRWAIEVDAEELAIQSKTDAGVLTGEPVRAQHTGSLVLDPFSKQILPVANNTGTIGSPLRKWQSVYAQELQVDVLTYAETLATSGGRWLIAPSTYLLEDIGTADTTIKVKHNNLANGDRIYSENNGRAEHMAVTSAATRINKAGISNLSAETGTTDWGTSGVATLTSSTEQHWHGGKSMKWTYTSGTANITYGPTGMLADTTVYMVSLYVKRFDGAAVVPVAGGNYRLYVDANHGITCDATAQDVGNGWYRLSCSGTSGSPVAAGTGVATIPTTTAHYFDAVQVETGATLTAWNRDSSSYTVTRGLEGSADVWEAGTGIVNTRQTGAGLIDCYATQGFSSATAIGPSCSFMVRTSSTYNAMSPRTLIGNLNGWYGYVADVYGFAAGDPAASNITIDPTNGVRIRSGVTDQMVANAGTLSLISGAVKIDSTGMTITPSPSWTNQVTYGFEDAYTGGGRPGMHYLENTGIGGASLRIWNEPGTGATLAETWVQAKTPDDTTNYILLQPGRGVEIGATKNVEFQSRPIASGLSGTDRFLINLDNTVTTSPGHPWLRTNGDDFVINGDPNLYLNTDIGGVVFAENLQFSTAGGGVAAIQASYGSISEFAAGTGSPIAGIARFGDGSGWQWRWYSRTSSTDTLRFTFDDRGRLGIGNINPAYSIELAADSAAKPTSSTWTIASDARSKRNVRPLDAELTRIRRLNLVSFEHNGRFGTPDGARGVGALANEVQAIFPDAIRTVTPNTSTPGQASRAPAPSFLAMDWHGIFVANVKAVQELAAKVERLEAEAKKKPATPATGGRGR